jgi:type I restriction enzyme S subunit
MTGKRKLPEGWRWEKIEDHVSDYQSGLARGEKSRGEGYPHLRMNNISNNLKLDLTSLWRIPANEDEVRSYCLQKGDILFNNTNSPELVGKSCLFNIDGNEIFLFSNHLTRIRTKSTLDSRYLLYWINALWRRKYFENNCDIWVNQAAVRVEDLLFPLEIPLPLTYDDQVVVVNELERKMANAEKMREASVRQKEAVTAMQGAILREAFPYKEGDKLPEGWKWRSLSDNSIIKIMMGQSPPGETYKKEHIGLPFFQGCADFGRLYPEPTVWCSAPQRIAEPNDILMSVRAPVGPTNIAKERCCIGRGLTSIRCKEGLSFRYLLLVLRNFEKKISSGGVGSIFDAIGKDEIEAIQFPLPPILADQMAITNELERKIAQVEKVHQATDRQLGAVEALPGTILREVFDFEEETK